MRESEVFTLARSFDVDEHRGGLFPIRDSSTSFKSRAGLPRETFDVEFRDRPEAILR